MRPLILVTNDDGVGSTGLMAAAKVAVALGEPLIVAPESQQTGMGRSFPRTNGQGVIRTYRRRLGDGPILVHAVTGSPAQAVAHAVLEVAPRQPTLCISGINDGENLGGTALVSGTVGAAMEAAGFGIPALAVSLGPEDPERFAKPLHASDWSVATDILMRFAGMLLGNGLPPGVAFLNINIPSSATLGTEIRVTIQSRHNHYSCTRPGPRNFARPLRLPISSAVDLDTVERDSDLYAFLVDGVVSVTPMRCDLTARDVHAAAAALGLGTALRAGQLA